MNKPLIGIRLLGASSGEMDAAYMIDMARIVKCMRENGYPNATTAHVLAAQAAMIDMEQANATQQGKFLELNLAGTNLNEQTQRPLIRVPRLITRTGNAGFDSFQKMITFPAGYHFTDGNANIGYPFASCYQLRELPVINCTGAIVEPTAAWLSQCRELRNICGLTNYKGNLDVRNCSKLTKQAVLNVFDSIASAPSGTTYTITLNTATYALLNSSEIALATQKGYAVASAAGN